MILKFNLGRMNSKIQNAVTIKKGNCEVRVIHYYLTFELL